MNGRYRISGKRLVLAFLLTAGLMFGAEEPKGEEKAGGVPEVSVLWKWANFAILFGALGYLASKQVGPLLKQRSQQITEGLAAGEKAKAEAAEKTKEIDARLGNLEGEISRLRTQAKEDRDREAVRLQKELLHEMDRIRHHAEVEIEAASKQAAIEVRRHAAALALQLAEQKVKARMSSETQAALFENFVKKVAGEEKTPVVS